MYSKSDYRTKISKLAAQNRVASFESILSKVDAMSDQQRNEFIDSFVKNHGLSQTINLIRRTLVDLSINTKQAQLYEGLKTQPLSGSPTPSQLKQKLNDAGDWGYLLTILLMIGTAGGADLGGDWKQILKGFAITVGTGFLAWCIKRLSSHIK